MADDYWRPAFELMLEEARRSIDRQSERVQTVRERAAALVGFGSIVLVALGLGEDGEPLGAFGTIGLGSFVLVAAVALYILWPREFRFELSARQMDEWFEPAAKTTGVNHMLQTAAIRHDEHHAWNHKKLKRLQAAIAVGVLALTVETLALVARLVL